MLEEHGVVPLHIFKMSYVHFFQLYFTPYFIRHTWDSEEHKRNLEGAVHTHRSFLLISTAF
uniref:Uncharacterized protein n=1 Tax=Oryzias latipes TaxID=8090 RepID=A0A3P9H0N3_ORYLA